jgi:hypothetical protein
MLGNNPSAKIVWFTDDIIESYFDLLFIEKLLQQYNVSVTLIPKNGKFGNDASFYDIKRMIGQTFDVLMKEQRFHVIDSGPLMAAANLRKLSKPVEYACEYADFLSHLVKEFFNKVPEIYHPNSGGRCVCISFESTSATKYIGEINNFNKLLVRKCNGCTSSFLRFQMHALPIFLLPVQCGVPT